MEEGRVTIQVKKRAIHDDTKYWGKTDPTFRGNPPAIRKRTGWGVGFLVVVRLYLGTERGAKGRSSIQNQSAILARTRNSSLVQAVWAV